MKSQDLNVVYHYTPLFSLPFFYLSVPQPITEIDNEKIYEFNTQWIFSHFSFGCTICFALVKITQLYVDASVSSTSEYNLHIYTFHSWKVHSLVSNIKYRNYASVVNSRWVTLVPCGVRWTRIQIAIQMDNLGTVGFVLLDTFSTPSNKNDRQPLSLKELYPVICSQDNLSLKSVGGFRLRMDFRLCPFK